MFSFTPAVRFDGAQRSRPRRPPVVVPPIFSRKHFDSAFHTLLSVIHHVFYDTNVVLILTWPMARSRGSPTCWKAHGAQCDGP